MKAGRHVALWATTLFVLTAMLVLAFDGVAMASVPELTITQPSSGSATGSQTPTFGGTTTDTSDPITLGFDPITLDIYPGLSTGEPPIAELTVPAPSREVGFQEDTWEGTLEGTTLEQGQYTAVAEQTSTEAGTGSSLPVTFTVETAPVVTLIAPSEDAVLKSSEPTLEGGGGSAAWDEQVAVKIHEGNSLNGSTVASEAVSVSEGKWSYRTPDLPDGVYTAQATQADGVHTTGTSQAVTFTLDTTPPALTLTAPSEGAVLKESQPALTGRTGTANWDYQSVTVTIHEGTSATGPVVGSPGSASVSSGKWSYSTPELADGVYTAQAEQSDEAGNRGTVTVTFTVDTTPPALTLTVPSEGAVLKESEPTLTGRTGTASWDYQSVTVTIHEGTSATGPVVGSPGSASVSSGKWSYSTPELADGVYTAQAEQSDEAGDRGTVTVTFTVDTTPPALTLTVPSEGAVLKESEPTLTGRTGTASWDYQSVTVTIHEGTSATGPVVGSPGSASVSSGKWSYSTPELAEGVYTAQAEQGDEAGNEGTVTVTFTVDAVAPVVSMNAVVPNLSNNPTPTLTGEAGVAGWEDSNVTVTIHEGGSPTGRAVGAPGSAAVNASSGAWSYSVPHLSDGEYTAEATQGDEAGNTGESNPETFVIDTTPPDLTLKTPAPGPPLHISQPTFSGLAGDASGDEPTVTLTVYDAEDGEVSAGPIEITPNDAHEWTTGSTGPRLPNGIYTAFATQRDKAGNEAKKSTTFTIDTNSPDVTLGTSGFVTRGSQLLTGPTPSFSGTGATEPEDSSAVIVKIYSGNSASGTPLRPPVQALLSSSEWTTGPVEALPDGTYTVQAEQEDSNSQTGVSKAVTFTVDANAPLVTLSSPSNGSSTTSSSQTVSGSAGTEEGDLPDVSVQLYAGSSNGGQALESITVGASAGGWSTVLGGLSPGTYTAQAEQSDDVGNVGHSEPVTFTVLAPTVAKSPSPPAASFTWFPTAPHTGEAISLVSTSTDASTAIASFGWALAGNDVFSTGGSTISTSFSTAGPHVVQLRVVDANGQSSVVSETIPVSTPAIPLMQPFPVVRIAGSFNSGGAKIGVLTVLAPVGATVRVTCRGGGCPAKPQSLRATAPAKSKASTVLVRFRRFERSLRAGVVLDVWVSDAGELGKFTRFVIRRDKAPTRTDLCLNPAGTVPLVCPAS